MRLSIFCFLCSLLVPNFVGAAPRGDTVIVISDIPSLTELALRLYGDASLWKEIAQWNNIQAPFLIEAQQKLVLKKKPTLTPAQGDERVLQMWRRRLSEGAKWQVVQQDEAELDGRSAWGVSPSLGVTYVSYTQTGVAPYRGWVVTGAVALSYRLRRPALDFGINTYYTVLPFSEAWPNMTMRFFGMNGRVGGRLPWLSEPWTLKLMVGGYFATVFVTNNRYGYANIGGPQIYPMVIRVLSGGHSLSGYLKFSPIMDGISVLGLASREIAGGLALVWQAAPRSIRLGLDISELRIDMGRAGVIETRTGSISVGLIF